jgi:preprotein translocase subunit SecB
MLQNVQQIVRAMVDLSYDEDKMSELNFGKVIVTGTVSEEEGGDYLFIHEVQCISCMCHNGIN